MNGAANLLPLLSYNKEKNKNKSRLIIIGNSRSPCLG
ncbi:hypothetical protein CP8484711_0910A, partial [Chlamydia psittaci 84-8471/1]